MWEVRDENRKVQKRVFETTWSGAAVYLMDKVPFQQEQFFQAHPANRSETHTLREIVAPYSISYRDLTPFLGKKTRVTIEVIP